MTDSLRRTLLLFALLVVTGLAFASVASASPPPVIDQYYEEIPTANGGVGGGGNSGGGGGGSDGGGLPAPILNQLESSVSPSVASGLKEVATSSRLGAPTAMFKKPVQGGESASGDSAASDSVSSAVTAATDGGEAHLTILLILIGLITGSGIVAAAARRRRQPLA